MTRRGRRQARRHAQDQRDRAYQDWETWRASRDQAEEDRLREELRKLASRPGWRLQA